MRKKRQHYNPDFKTKVAIEAVKEQKTISDLSGEFELHGNQIIEWKKNLKQNAYQIFETTKGTKVKEQEELIDRLYKQIGQLQVELDWLKKKIDK